MIFSSFNLSDIYPRCDDAKLELEKEVEKAAVHTSELHASLQQAEASLKTVHAASHTTSTEQAIAMQKMREELQKAEAEAERWRHTAEHAEDEVKWSAQRAKVREEELHREAELQQAGQAQSIAMASQPRSQLYPACLEAGCT